MRLYVFFLCRCNVQNKNKSNIYKRNVLLRKLHAHCLHTFFALWQSNSHRWFKLQLYSLKSTKWQNKTKNKKIFIINLRILRHYFEIDLYSWCRRILRQIYFWLVSRSYRKFRYFKVLWQSCPIKQTRYIIAHCTNLF